MLLFEALQIMDAYLKDARENHPGAKDPIAALDITVKAITAQIRLSEMLNSWWDDLKEDDRLSAQAAYEILNTIRFDYDPEKDPASDQYKEDPETVAGIIQETVDEICRNFCKYQETIDDNAECQWIREGNECPLDRLQ